MNQIFNKPAPSKYVDWDISFCWPWEVGASWLFLPWSGYAEWKHNPKVLIELRGVRICGVTVQRFKRAGATETNECLIVDRKQQSFATRRHPKPPATESVGDNYQLYYTVIAALINEAGNNSIAHGFSHTLESEGDDLMLIIGELAEYHDAKRHGKGDSPSDHIPEFSYREEELADVVIRVMDLSYQRNFRLAAAILAKMKYNEGRPFKHGKEF